MKGVVFTRSGFEALISEFLSAGYSPASFGESSYVGAQFILRHDVDFSLDHAVKQAQTNASLGVWATFFFLLSADFYNLASAHGRRVLREIGDTGQKIGLHFDATLYDHNQEIEDAVGKECRILADLASAVPAAVSFHRPVPSLLGHKGDIAGIPSAYDSRYFEAMEYCSDSRGGFHHGHPLERRAFRDRRPFQLLTHPIWWMREAECGPVNSLLEWLKSQREQQEKKLGANSEVFKNWLDEQRLKSAG